MKTLNSRTSINRFPFVLLSLALLVKGTIIIWFVWHLYGLDDLPPNVAHQYGFWSVAAIIIVLAITLFVWLATIHSLYRSQKTILANNAEQTRTEKALQQSEARFRELFENANDLVYTTDLQGNFTSLNKVGESITGYTRKEACKMHFAQVVAPEYLELARGMLALKRENNVPTTYEIEFITKSGKRIALDISNSLIYEANVPIGVQGIARDITARKQVEKTLRESEARYRIVTESASDAILTIDHKHTILFVNSAAEKIFGYTVNEMLGSKLFMLMPESMRGAHAAGMKRYKETNKRNISWQGVELPGLHKDGSEVPLEITFGEIISDGKHLFTAVIRDITERKRAEEGLRQSEEKYRTILETIEEGYFETDLEGIFTFYNKALGNVLGYDTDELLGMHYQHYVDHRNAKKLFISYVKVYRTGQPRSELNWEVIRKDGTRRFLESSITLIRNADGEPGGFRGLVRDVTERRQAEDTLRESEFILAAAQRITHLGSWELDLIDLIDLSKNEVRWSDETYRIFGYEPGQIEVSSEAFYNAVHPADRAHVSQVLIEAIEQRKIYNIEHRIILPDGRERILHGQAELIFDKPTGKPLKLLGTVQDITERKTVEEALRDSEYKLRTLITSMSEGLTQVSNDEVIEFVNDRLCEMTGYERDELLGKVTLEIFFDEEGCKLLESINRQRQKGISGQYEMRLRKKSGEMLWVLIGGSPIVNADGVMTGTLGVFTDITERKRAEEQLLHDAFHDGLTGLANRALFMDHLRMTIERSKSRHSNPYAVLFLDFDRFKMVNDSLGHAEGDRLLNQIARRLESSTRTGDLVARLGGDEFVILLSEMLVEGDAVQVAERIQKDLKKPFDLSGSEIFISASIGIALSNAGHKRAEDMVRDADIAMYRAKAGGKAQYRVFDRAMHEYASSQLQFETEMRQAIEHGEFGLHYQPIISLDTETLVGFEALVRWQHPTRGMIPPLEFIGAAEENGLILPLGNWILQESCRQLRRWQDDNPAASRLMMSVNLSCKQFLQTDLAEQIAAALGKSGLDPRCLKLEITESYIMETSETAVIIMNRLRALGIEISLDDFGTGYSSLSYLHRLPVDYLKIDRSFVSRMTDSKENCEIVRTIIKLAQNLKMKTIAEGIETADQLAHLKNLHCEYGQGFFFSKPLEAKAAEKFIEENSGDFPFVINQDFGVELNM